MSTLLTTQYQTEVDRIIRHGGSRNETALRGAFQHLLNEYCKQKNLLLVPELDYRTALGKAVRPDGTVKDVLCLDWGYWESKDQFDDLDEEINKKFAKGYPQDNIIFEDSLQAVLYQQSRESLRVPMRDAVALDEILSTFLSYERPEVKSFRQAIEQFKQHIPAIVVALREIIDAQSESNPAFRLARTAFLDVCRRSINSDVRAEDVREMLIQHILTEEIFLTIFEEAQFHQENNIAKELKKVEDTFFSGSVKRSTLERVRPYYTTIKAQAARIADHHEKQRFLKIIYENFYKAYNAKGADRLGIVYTPNEVVRFMIESTDFLLHKRFGRMLGDMGVEILDPATGTGTYITELIDYLPPDQLGYKYRHEMHANEVSILPYYIANLNIEYTYKQRMGHYEEFKNICFVDTLDNTGALHHVGKQTALFGLSAENAERIKRQNEKKISVIIGNPPYNAKQENYNDHNANREYPFIDKRIKDTYSKAGTAQNQLALYDMYVRFFRWATDRVHQNGVVAFISNNSFIHSQSFDGFRKLAAQEFNEIYIIDLKGNARTSGERRRQEGGNIFSDEIRVGVAVYFMVKSENLEGCRIYYNGIRDYAREEEKKQYLREHKLNNLSFQSIIPDRKHCWINQTDNDFDSLLPLVDKNVKAGKGEKAVFKLFSRGIATQRDEWVYDINQENLAAKMKLFVEVYQQEIANSRLINSLKQQPEYEIKWDRELTKYLKKGIRKQFSEKSIQPALYRPYVQTNLYFDRHFNGMTYQWKDIYRSGDKNLHIAFSAPGNTKPFHCLATDLIADLHLTGDSQCLSLYRYDPVGNQIDNITDWGLKQFQNRYSDQQREITKEAIFYYTYAVLHNPSYREKYALNLKRELPRLPFYQDFRQWVKWGKCLLDWHINYQQAACHQLRRQDQDKAAGKVKLKADIVSGQIILDEKTTLSGIPTEAWEYKLGNRSALEWVLDQYKASKPADPTIAAHFNAYRFDNYKEQVIELLMRVCTISIETVRIQREMQKLNY